MAVHHPTRRVPATNNGSESAIRGFKLAAKVQGCWWLGEVAGLQDSLRHIADKKQHAQRLAQLAVDNDNHDLILG